MPIFINIESALLKWQAKHNQRMTYEELARRAGITIAALYRMKSGSAITPDLRKINSICKVLECEPGDLFFREATEELDEDKLLNYEVERDFDLEQQRLQQEFDEQMKKKAKKS